MAAKATQDIGTLIKEARTGAGLSQAKLADAVEGLTASDISKAERGEKFLTNDQLKAIAKLCGVTQSSLVNASKAAREKAEKASSGSSSGKTSSASKKKTSGKTSSGKTSSAKKSDEYKLTAAEKTLIDLYRKADSDTKKEAVRVLKGEKSDMENIISAVVGAGIDMFAKKAEGK